jgi:ribonuclease HI
MNELVLLTDGSVDTRSKTGYGAYLIVTESERDLPVKDFESRVKVKRFDGTSSTRLELQTLLWALDSLDPVGVRVVVYTDSQNIISLQGRREKLMARDFQTKKNTRLKNASLYKEFFRMTDRLDCQFIKVKGHQPLSSKNRIHKLFTRVDRASRRALRDRDR